MQICMTEPTKDSGSIGCYYVMEAARRAGFAVDHINYQSEVDDYDIELVSIHHYTDLIELAKMKQHGKIRILGGHVTASNPRPFIYFADAICKGEGEEWIVKALNLLKDNLSVDVLKGLEGTIICKDYQIGDPLPDTICLNKLPQSPIYLNRKVDGHSANYYLEIARGCPHKCHYCELGWAWKYRVQDVDYLLSQIDQLDRSKTNKVTLFAPDEISHQGYMTCLQRIFDRGFTTSFGSMRLDILQNKKTILPKNMLIRVGVDGLTQATRYKVNKPLSNLQIVNYFKTMIEQGFNNFKIFMVFGYEWEQLSDFKEFEMLMGSIFALPLKNNVHLRVKFTPLIPNMSTPLKDCKPQYNIDMVKQINNWFNRCKKPYRYPAFTVKSDGIMSEKNHRLQCLITQGEADVFYQINDLKNANTRAWYDYKFR